MLGYDTSRVNYFQDSELIERHACPVDASNSPHILLHARPNPTEFLWWRRLTDVIPGFESIHGVQSGIVFPRDHVNKPIQSAAFVRVSLRLKVSVESTHPATPFGDSISQI